MPSEMKRLRQLEEENARLKRIVADLSLDKEMLSPQIKASVVDPRQGRDLRPARNRRKAFNV